MTDALPMKVSTRELGALIEAFVNRISHPRGLLLNFALTIPGSTPSSLATIMKISLPSVSQMIERLVKLGLARRTEDSDDRRRKTISVTTKGRRLLARLEAVRSAEYAAGAAKLSPATRRRLVDALSEAMRELAPPGAPPSPTLRQAQREKGTRVFRRSSRIADRRRLLQAQHIGDVGRVDEGVHQRHFGRAGIAEDVSDALVGQNVEQNVARASGHSCISWRLRRHGRA